MKKCLSLLTALLCAAAMLLTACGKEPSPGSSVIPATVSTIFLFRAFTLFFTGSTVFSA